jgi:PIN domain nuclease of toxin-antitoxin system
VERGEVIVLDTHVWIWAATEPSKLSERAARSLEYSKTLGLCPISVWEISTQESLGRLAFDRPLEVWLAQMLAQPRLKVLELLPQIALLAGQLGREGFHGDPADRMIVATAIFHGWPLVTKDRAIRDFPGVESIW